jgi:hypothetical protein|tara:strand:+ start:52 stop:285 length:234 start_codon:yes stop_codon:yes gene_type:complete
MSVLDPIKTVRATVSNNIVGSVIGGAAGYYFLRNRLPIKGKLGVAVSIVGGLLAGAYVSKMVLAKKGAAASATESKK